MPDDACRVVRTSANETARSHRRPRRSRIRGPAAALSGHERSAIAAEQPGDATLPQTGVRRVARMPGSSLLADRSPRFHLGRLRASIHSRRRMATAGNELTYRAIKSCETYRPPRTGAVPRRPRVAHDPRLPSGPTLPAGEPAKRQNSLGLSPHPAGLRRILRRLG